MSALSAPLHRSRDLLASTQVQRTAVLGVFSAGLVLRLGLILAYRPTFLGIPDSGTYMTAAGSRLFSDPVDPVGYAAFLHALRWLHPSLLLVVLVQHAFGVVAAGLILLLGCRAQNLWGGLIAAAAVLFNGLELWVEHTPLSDSLFTFLCAGVLYVALRSSRGHPAWVALLGLLLGVTPIVRSVGVLLAPLVLVWLVIVAPGGWRRRLSRAVIPACLAAAILLGYGLVERHNTGVFGFTESDGRIAYAVAAPFAECSHFTPPAGTRGLCQRSPPGRRQSFNAYLWGFPDHAAALPPGGRGAVSPAWRLFGAMPSGNAKLGAFGRAAILGQPVAFLSQAWGNLATYWEDGPSTFVTDAITPQPGLVAIAQDEYHSGQPRGDVSGFLESYALHVEVKRWLLALVLFASPLALLTRRRWERSVAGLCAAAGWVLLGGSALVAADPRYVLPAIGPLVLADVIAVAAVIDRLGRIVRRRHSFHASQVARRA